MVEGSCCLQLLARQITLRNSTAFLPTCPAGSATLAFAEEFAAEIERLLATT
jgi:hypothetical protein